MFDASFQLKKLPEQKEHAPDRSSISCSSSTPRAPLKSSLSRQLPQVSAKHAMSEDVPQVSAAKRVKTTCEDEHYRCS